MEEEETYNFVEHYKLKNKSIEKISDNLLTDSTKNKKTGIAILGDQEGHIFLKNLKKKERENIKIKLFNQRINKVIWISDYEIVVAGNSSDIKILNVEKESLESFVGHNRSVTSVCKYSENVFFSGGRDSTVYKWDLRQKDTENLNCDLRNLKPNQSVTSINYCRRKPYRIYTSHTFPFRIDLFDIRYYSFGNVSNVCCVDSKNSVYDIFVDKFSHFVYSIDSNGSIGKHTTDLIKYSSLYSSNSIKSSQSQISYSISHDLKFFSHPDFIALTDSADNLKKFDIKKSTGNFIYDNFLYLTTETGHLEKYKIKIK